MMKKLLLAFVAVVAMASCGSKNTYKINGHVEGLEDGTMMTLNVIDYNSLMPLDSVVLKNGKFSFKGETDTTEIAVVTLSWMTISEDASCIWRGETLMSIWILKMGISALKVLLTTMLFRIS